MKHNKQTGKIGIAAVGLILSFTSLVMVVVFSYISAFNYGNKTEQELISILENNKNIYSQGTQKVLEIAQVPGMYAEDLTKLIKQDIEGRYGDQGSKASVQFLKEHEIKLDPSMYAKIQQAIEGFRDDFKNNQTRLIDVKRVYQTSLGSFWDGTWLRVAGYPKIDLTKYVPVTTETTEKVFKDGKETAPLKLR